MQSSKEQQGEIRKPSSVINTKKHPKTQINKINEDQTQTANIKISKGKSTDNTQGDLHKDNS